MLVLDEGGRIVFCGADVAEIFGRPRADLVGGELTALLAEAARPSWRQTFGAVGPSTRIEASLVGLHRDESSFPVALTLERSTVAETPLWVGTLRRSSGEEAGRSEAEATLETLLEHAPALIIAVSRSGTIDYINRVLPQYSRADVIGSSWLLYFPPEDQPKMTAALASVLAGGAPETYEVTTPGPDGSPMWFSSQLGPIRRGSEIVGAVIVSQDITATKQTLAELLAARRMAVLGTLAAGVAHEINTPIQFVGDSLQFLRSAGDDLLALIETLQELRAQALKGASLPEVIARAAAAEEEADLPYLRANIPSAFERCVEGLNRVATIVGSLKEFAHPSAMEMLPSDLNHAILSTLTIAKHEYKYVADVVTDLGDIPLVTCHVGEINQVVLNIVVNASHAIEAVVTGSDRRGIITVRTRLDGDAVVISIADTGSGIAEEHRSRIFDPFFTTKQVGKGSGQGLSIAWTAVTEHHHGEITFDSAVGEGTVFHIRLPINAPVEAASAAA